MTLRQRGWEVAETVVHGVAGPVYETTLAGESFRLSMERPHHQILRGEYEPGTVAAIADRIDDIDSVWEVGARWGVFSMWLLANDHVEWGGLFEADPERVRHLTRSIAANGVQSRAQLHLCRLDRDLTLDRFGPAPDLVVVDLEGAEAEVIPESQGVLDSQPTWIVEQHDGVELADTFRAAGYRIEVLHQAGDRTWLLAEGSR